MTTAIILEVHETADGYSIKRSDSTIACWWGFDYGYDGRHAAWVEKYRRKTYRAKWRAIRKAQKLEAKLNAERREQERRRNFVEKKVWR